MEFPEKLRIFAAEFKAIAIMEATVFNPAQVYLLHMFERIETEEELLEIKKLISDYFAKKMDAHLDKLWDEGVLDQKRLDEINKMDLHQLK